MSDRFSEKIQVLTTKAQKTELEEHAMDRQLSQGEIVREALRVLFEQWRKMEGGN